LRPLVFLGRERGVIKPPLPLLIKEGKKEIVIIRYLKIYGIHY
jgi:predicted DNA-binding antitoxin AbrB/MazE fold protein